MEEENKKVLTRAVVNVILAFALFLIVSYIKQVFFEHVPFTPNFMRALGLALCCGVASYYGMMRKK